MPTCRAHARDTSHQRTGHKHSTHVSRATHVTCTLHTTRCAQPTALHRHRNMRTTHEHTNMCARHQSTTWINSYLKTETTIENRTGTGTRTRMDSITRKKNVFLLRMRGTRLGSSVCRRGRSGSQGGALIPFHFGSRSFGAHIQDEVPESIRPFVCGASICFSRFLCLALVCSVSVLHILCLFWLKLSS